MNNITESQVAEWMKSKLLELRDSGETLDYMEFSVNTWTSQPTMSVSVSDTSQSEACAGCCKPSIAEALAAMNAQIAELPNSAAEKRDAAQKLLAEAEKIDGKAVYLTLSPDASSAAAEAVQEGRLLPKARPNPHGE